MANYIVSYALKGPGPTPQELDQHMGRAGWARVRILETIWYVGADERTEEVFNHISAILSEKDQLMVVSAAEAFWRNLLIPDDRLQVAFASNA